MGVAVLFVMFEGFWVCFVWFWSFVLGDSLRLLAGL